MSNKKAAAGLVSGLVGLIGGMVFIWLLVFLFSSGAIVSFSGSTGFWMFVIFLLFIWIISKKK